MKKALIGGLIGVCLAGAAAAQDAPAPTVRPSSPNIRDLQIRGRVQAQAAFVSAKNDDVTRDWSTFEVRRVRMGLRGTLFQNVRAQLEATLVPGSSLSMRSAFIEWREHAPAYVMLGFDKPRFGHEENTSSAAILTVERSMLTGTFAPGPMTGLAVNGNVELLSYGLGVYTDRANANPANEGANYLFNGSVVLTLDPLVGQTLRLRADVLHSADEGGNFGGRFETAVAGSLHFAAGPFDLRAEYIHGEDRNSDSTGGFYIMPSFYITPQIQAVARYERMTSDRATGVRAASRYARRVPGLETPEEGPDPTRGDLGQALYLGGSYYLAGNNQKLMLGVELAEIQNTSAGALQSATVLGAWRMLF